MLLLGLCFIGFCSHNNIYATSNMMDYEFTNWMIVWINVTDKDLNCTVSLLRSKWLAGNTHSHCLMCHFTVVQGGRWEQIDKYMKLFEDQIRAFRVLIIFVYMPVTPPPCGIWIRLRVWNALTSGFCAATCCIQNDSPETREALARWGTADHEKSNMFFFLLHTIFPQTTPDNSGPACPRLQKQNTSIE